MRRFCFCALFLTFCSAQAALPPLIPREILFGNPARTDPKVSPDGSQLSWLAPDKSNTLNVWTSALDGTHAHCVTNETGDPIEWYTWAGDGKHVLYLHDNAGDEIPHLFSTDLMTGNVRDLTPFRGVRAQNVLTDSRHPAAVLVAMNLRDRTKFDMYRVDLETGAITIEAQNPGDVLTWRADNNFVLRAATAFDGTTGRTIIRVRDAGDKPWRDLVVMPFERALFAGQVVNGSLIVGFDPDGKSLLIVSALHSDKGRLVRVDLQDGHERGVIAEDPHCDVAFVDVGRLGMEPGVILHPVTGAVQAVQFNYMTPQWSFVDPKLKTDFENINREAPGFFDLVSRDNADRVWIVASRRSDAPVTYYKFDRGTKKLSRLFTENPALAKFAVAAKKPGIIKTRDGLEIVSYLTIAPGVDPRKVPLVLLIHGGPWDRDSDVYDPEVQFLANRGYAVLQANYRGSTGFGIKFFNAGNLQVGLGMVEDVLDAVRWAVDQGIADPKRVAAMGGSMGGFATLRALEMRPDLFACGVDEFGPADEAVSFRSSPSYWSNILARWRRRAGDADHDENWNRKISPLFHVDAIRAPLLIVQGKNDPRVTMANADAMVAALRKAKRDVTYVVYPDEGHGFARPENQFDFYGRGEEFLAKHLGGRAEPWKKIPGATGELR
ncbi:MAG: S9 family peptidase [Verrucomicrobia bacterium]|nr:MAG: S9 family peptidase [Verrucomicrobiota bacterium]PYK74589.1 MAG: S9 family peptidase [Verrucomicrobiota bacterium]